MRRGREHGRRSGPGGNRTGSTKLDRETVEGAESHGKERAPPPEEEEPSRVLRVRATISTYTYLATCRIKDFNINTIIPLLLKKIHSLLFYIIS